MRKVLTGLALLAPAISTAQVPYRGQSGYDTGPVVPCTALDGSGPSRCLMPGAVIYDQNGAPLGTATNPVITSSSGGGNGNTLDVQGAGSLALATANATYSITLAGGRNAVGLTINGLTGSGATITVERSNDGGTTWTNANTTESSTTATLSATITANGQARVGVAGATNIRLRVSTAGTGTATVAYNATTAAGPVFLTSFLPSTTTPGVGVIGNVGLLDGGDAAEGSRADAAYTDTTGAAAGSLTALNKGEFVQLSTLFKAGQSIGNTAFALNAGTNSIGTVGLNAGTNAIGSITNTGFNVNNFPATQAVSGTVTANGQGAVTAAAPTYTTGSQAALSLTTAGALRTDASATTQPISAASLPLPSGAATSANQSTQITAEQAIQAQIGATSSPAAGSTNAQLAAILANQTNSTSKVQLVNSGGTAITVQGSGDGAGNLIGLAVVGQGQVYNGSTWISQRGDVGGTWTIAKPDAAASSGIAPTTVQGATSNVLKTAAGNVYSVNVVNSTAAGFLVIYNATAAPASGTAISAANGLYCMPVAASVGFRDTFLTPIYASTGATLLMSTSCTTYTPIGTAPITLTGQAK